MSCSSTEEENAEALCYFGILARPAGLDRRPFARAAAAIDRALDEAGIKQDIIYGSYRTDAVTRLNDGLFSWEHTYPDLLQVAMPSLYVAGNQMAVATRIAAIREKLDSNDIIPWLSTGTYGQYAPPNTRDMILEAFAKSQLGKGTGGPKDPAMLYDLEILCRQLAGLRLEIAREVEREVHEGRHHTGLGSVIQILAVRKA